LTTYETNAAFGESITAFEKFIQEFPNSKNVDNAYDYLSTVYLTSKNYDAAYQSILKIKNLSPKLIDTKQYLEYQVGTQAFASSNYNRAVEFFSKAIQTAPSGRYLADAYFWRSESFYRINDFVRAETDLNAFFNIARVQMNPNYVQGYYSLGYALFRQRKYAESLSWFLKYLDNAKDPKSVMYIDALNRVGDAYYSVRNFAKANEFYAKAMADQTKGDYALFQTAYMSGIQKNYNQKINQLEQLLIQFPNSEYGDDALYEIGRSYLMIENNTKVIESYRRLLSAYPNSTIAPKAQLEIGMVYFNENDYNNAIPVFKQVISDYPVSEEAEVALESLETIYINTNNVSSYMDYVRSLGRKVDAASVIRTDSITFMAAERLYISENYSEAITGFTNYIQQYCPNGKFCTTAANYLADSYYVTGNKDKALEEYSKIINMRGNPNVEQAALRAAEIAYDNKDFAGALNFFNKLSEVAQTTENKNIARLGVLRSSYNLNNADVTIKIATEIANDPKSTVAMKSEALLNRAKAYVQQNKLSDALKDLNGINADTRSSIGAEAKFLLADVNFKLNQLNTAENEVLDFAKKGTPHQYWLARSFVVLSDVYIQKGDDFQAKQYLLSLQKNYTVQDDVQEMINSRLSAIEGREKQRVVTP
jgi:TolA-binding protein